MQEDEMSVSLSGKDSEERNKAQKATYESSASAPLCVVALKVAPPVVAPPVVAPPVSAPAVVPWRIPVVSVALL